MTLQASSQPFLTDIDELRRLARQDIDKGAVTEAYGLDVNQVVDVLNRVLASEIICVLRYKSHYYMAKGIHAEPVASEFLEHAANEQEHVERVAMRITQLNGDPDLNPEGMSTRAISHFSPGGSLIEMIKEDLIAERVVVMWYAELARWFGDADPTSRRMMEELLADEEDHAQDLADLLANLGDTGMQNEGRSTAHGPGGTQGLPGMREGESNGLSDGLDGR